MFNLSPKALETFEAIKALRELPTDTRRAEDRLLRRLRPSDLTAIAVALQEYEDQVAQSDAQETEASHE